MRVRWPLFATVVTATVAYAAYPYVTLYRLGTAMQTADAATLERLVDWHAVREGIKEDVCDYVVDTGPAQPQGSLPTFGSGFIRGIASNAIDRQVTPQAIVAASTAAPSKDARGDSRQEPRAETPASAMARVSVDWAFFESPTVFTVDLRAQGVREPVRMELDLREGIWQVRRVWLPVEMLKGPPSRT
ncbi:DUF2939 domain-containing protein [Rhodopila sp.]|jgi:hypothetical protein|uniref:DUF2939 domain-containing protein n=1 Tax=Rhodopila sp. TaxID=2480087 RepID=UPI002C49B5D7|nr:DUF2939 domain-containing protein [Rhodopila sp.]HVZ10261.1 DUF2939 domain-containing protein [Rhodopila sp.]